MNINPNHSHALSQKKAICNYLRNGGSITGLEAIEKFGCIKLSNRISELRSAGITIADRWVVLGCGKRVKQYFMPKSA